MLDILIDRVERTSSGLSRRDFLRVGALGTAALSLPEMLRQEAMAKSEPKAESNSKPQPKAKSIIQIWLQGGPPHTDTFDPKPGSGPDYTGPYNKPIATNVDGIIIGQKLPQLAKLADKYSLLRGMTHGVFSHETATYVVQTGTMPSPELVYPSIGSVIAFKKGTPQSGYQGSLPPNIALTSPLGRFPEAGFLGDQYKAYATGGNPNASQFQVQGLVSPKSMTDEHWNQRRELLSAVDSLAKKMETETHLQQMQAHQKKAYELILGDAKKAFDISSEDANLRDRYGRTAFGQSCLLARRMAEHGVPFTMVNSGGWDTHKNHFERMDTKLPELDKGLAMLIEDLDQRGLLDTTIVYCLGEFGRTPKIATGAPWYNGRHHFGAVQACLIAGGGFKGGRVVGKTNPRGEQVVERPIYPWDLSASIYQLMGIDPGDRLPHPHGCVVYVTPTARGNVPSGGMLTEIM